MLIPTCLTVAARKANRAFQTLVEQVSLVDWDIFRGLFRALVLGTALSGLRQRSS